MHLFSPPSQAHAQTIAITVCEIYNPKTWQNLLERCQFLARSECPSWRARLSASSETAANIITVKTGIKLHNGQLATLLKKGIICRYTVMTETLHCCTSYRCTVVRVNTTLLYII
jgi:hypothetical protein